MKHYDAQQELEKKKRKKRKVCVLCVRVYRFLQGLNQSCSKSSEVGQAHNV